MTAPSGDLRRLERWWQLDLDTDEVDVTGVRPGTTYYYRVTRLIVESSTSGGERRDAGTSSSTWSRPTTAHHGRATPLNRPQIMSPLENDSLNLNSQVFSGYRWAVVISTGCRYRIARRLSPSARSIARTRTRGWRSRGLAITVRCLPRST